MGVAPRHPWVNPWGRWNDRLSFSSLCGSCPGPAIFYLSIPQKGFNSPSCWAPSFPAMMMGKERRCSHFSANANRKDQPCQFRSGEQGLTSWHIRISFTGPTSSLPLLSWRGTSRFPPISFAPRRLCNPFYRPVKKPTGKWEARRGERRRAEWEGG